MSIISIGTDIVEIKRIKKIFLSFRNKLARRILSENEYIKYFKIKNKIKFLAKSFAVKEAASKALGTGINCGITFNQLELYNSYLGKPKLRFLNNALKKLKKMKCKSIHVSTSDEISYSYAIVILEN
ncbi:Holo-[acyl-carrier-protein] synthase [Buchnera aphidicola (Protaphis terricola)]|uniref:holo-ACP synthase n=1 Tax=Buchnera aphidicola TaxID=9 RepID=UPI00346472F8